MKDQASVKGGILAVALATLAVVPRSARADIIFSNFGPGDTFNSNIGSVVASSQWIAAAFSPGANYTLTEIDLALQNFSGANGATVELVNSVSGLPGPMVLESWTLRGLPGPGSSSLPPADMLMSSGPAVQLLSGTQYWVIAMPENSTTQDSWSENSTGDVGNFARSSNSGTTWTIVSALPTPAFDVLGTPPAAIPEPSSLRDLFLALAGFCMLCGRLLLKRTSRSEDPRDGLFAAKAGNLRLSPE